MFAKWQQCCTDAVECCLNHLRHQSSSSSSSSPSATASAYKFIVKRSSFLPNVNQENQFLHQPGNLESSINSNNNNNNNKKGLGYFSSFTSSILTSDPSQVSSSTNDHFLSMNSLPEKFTSSNSFQLKSDPFNFYSQITLRKKRSQGK